MQKWLSRLLVLTSLTLTSLSFTAHAEDALTLWANYYKERSTRVIEPRVRLQKDLPYDTTLDVSYLVDQVTSASGAFTESVDTAFHEYRNDLRIGASTGALGAVRPGVFFHLSYEPDYTSISAGGDVALALNDENTALRVYGAFQTDDVRKREDDMFDDSLRTTLAGVGVRQLLARNAQVGLTLEGQFLRGYQENVYRREVHPRRRNRYAVKAWGSYQITETRSSMNASYRYYGDTWELVGHTLDVALAQKVFTWLELELRYRYYTQNGVYFLDMNPDFITMDPKLMPFHAHFYGVSVRWTLSLLQGTGLEALARSRIEPTYSYYDQRNFYGSAHIFQLGWYWPF